MKSSFLGPVRLAGAVFRLSTDARHCRGKPNPDRTWTECFAQLVGTVLSLWDAAELDAAGDDGEVLPKFLNLTDASIKMVLARRLLPSPGARLLSVMRKETDPFAQIESLPTKTNDEQPLQNILSISTAGRNRIPPPF